MTRRQLAEYYFHNDYSLAATTEEIQAIYPDVTREWIAEVWQELDDDILPF